MRTYFAFIVLVACVFSIGCDPTDDKLTIVNETSRPIFYSTSASDSIQGRNPYKNFIQISNHDTEWINSDYFIRPNSEKKKMVLSTWEATIRNNFGGKIHIFIFDADTLQAYTWENIKTKMKIVKEYQFTVDDLKKLNWKVKIVK